MARTYTVPQFNVTIDVWQFGHDPASGPADVVNQSAQLYVNARDPMKLWHDNVPTEIFPIIVRLPPVLAWTPHTTDIMRRSVVGGGLYKFLWIVTMHAGFPNEYIAIYSAQCDNGRNLISPA